MATALRPSIGTRRRAATLACAAAAAGALALAGCGGGGGSSSGSQASAPPSSTAKTASTARQPARSRPPFVARLHAPGHHPRAGKPWPITIQVRTRNGKPLAGSVNYQFVTFGQVVARRPGHRFKGGHFRDTLQFPAPAVGHPITLRILIATPAGTRRVDYPVQVRR